MLISELLSDLVLKKGRGQFEIESSSLLCGPSPIPFRRRRAGDNLLIGYQVLADRYWRSAAPREQGVPEIQEFVELGN